MLIIIIINPPKAQARGSGDEIQLERCRNIVDEDNLACGGRAIDGHSTELIRWTLAIGGINYE
jgi:hypothetical protein